jgi:hypothetical protein
MKVVSLMDDPRKEASDAVALPLTVGDTSRENTKVHHYVVYDRENGVVSFRKLVELLRSVYPDIQTPNDWVIRNKKIVFRSQRTDSLSLDRRNKAFKSNCSHSADFKENHETIERNSETGLSVFRRHAGLFKTLICLRSQQVHTRQQCTSETQTIAQIRDMQ